jgi:hypothetical protein
MLIQLAAYFWEAVTGHKRSLLLDLQDKQIDSK